MSIEIALSSAMIRAVSAVSQAGVNDEIEEVSFNLNVYVVDANTNSSITGAKVTIMGQTSYSNTTYGGTAVFNEIQAGLYNLYVSKEGYEPAFTIITLSNDTQTTISLAPLTQTLTVHVIDANTNTSISKANVTDEGPENRSAFTEDGTVTFENITAGEYKITASAPGYSSASVIASATTTAEVWIILTPSTSEQTPSTLLLRTFAIILALGVTMAFGSAIILMAAADRIRRKRRKK